MNEKSHSKKKINNNIIFQNIKNSLHQEKSKRIFVTQKRKKKKGNYILGETIGQGAFAKVKLAKHIFTGEKVAIKILNKEKINKNSDIKKFKKEINILQKLKHKNIIQLYEIMETKKSLYIVMEYCEEKELFDYIVKRKHISEREACRYFQQIINGVEYLHLSKVTHRDLKPENLLLDSKKRILISDFGLSILSQDYNTLLSTPCGTPSYAPPEMLLGQKYNGIKSDIWSCGIILYTMLVGNLPCFESKEELVYQNIITHNYLYPENLSDDAIDLIEHILKINPEERYGFDEIKAHPWFNLTTPKLRPGIIYGVHRIPIDNKIMEKVEELGYDRKKVEENVINYKFDSLSAIYYLILKQFKKNEINSVSDLFSNDYLNYLKDYKNWINPSKANDPFFKDYEVELLDNLDDEDEMLWSPQADPSSELSKIIPEEENEIPMHEFKENIYNVNIPHINIINDNKNENDDNKNNKIINKSDKINDYIEIKNIKNNILLDSPDKTFKKKIKKNNTPNIENLRTRKIIKSNINSITSKKLNNKTQIMNKNKKNTLEKHSCKSIELNSPKTVIKNTTINNHLSLCDKIFFDNLNELEKESRILSQNSEFFTGKNEDLINLKKEEKNKFSISPLRSFNININSMTTRRNNKSDLYENDSNNYQIRIKRAKKKENEKVVLLSNELSKKKKQEIINKLKIEEEKFNEELDLIDNISMFNSNNKEKSMVGQIAEKFIKTTIFSKYLIGNKKSKNTNKDEIENKFYILQKYKNIIGMIEKMRNKIFSKKVNDFNFYTFDEYLNDDNDKHINKTIMKIPYFKSFIEKAKNIQYKKEPMEKRAYSKNYTIQKHIFNMDNNNIYTSHLSSYSNNFFPQNYNNKKQSQGMFDLISTPNNKKKCANFSNSRNKDFYLYNKNSNSKGTIRKELNSENHSRYYSVGRNYSKKSYSHNNIHKNCKSNSTKRFIKKKKIHENMTNIKAFKNRKDSDKIYMNDISENEESFSSFSSLDKNHNNKNGINPIISKENNDNNYIIHSQIIKKENISLPLKQFKNNNSIISSYNNKSKITVQLLNDKKQKEKNSENEISDKNSMCEEKNNNKKLSVKLKELNELYPIDLNNIVNLAPNIIIQKMKKYFKNSGYFFSDKGNIIKVNKGGSNIEISLFKLKFSEDDNIYISIRIKSLSSKNEKLILNEIIKNLKK